MKRLIFGSLLALGLVVTWPFPADAVDRSPGASAKLKAWVKLRSCEHKAAAKNALGETVDPSACQTKFNANLTKAGTGCRYVDDGDGTVTDLDTGLMWQKTDDAGGLTDKDNAYTWGDRGGDPDGSAFTTFIVRLNDCASIDGSAVTGGYAGHCDWRMPQVNELAAIVDCSFSDPCIDQLAFGPTNALSYYWSATAYADNSDFAWGVSFGSDDLGLDYKGAGFLFSVRAVRRGL